MDMKKWLFIIFPSAVGSILITTAFLHRQQLDISTEVYKHSAYIYYELISVLVLFLIILSSPIFIIKYAIKRQWRQCVQAGISAFLSFIYYLFGFFTDYPLFTG